MLITEPYLAQRQRWPSHGKHILAQFDAQSVVVYQAFRPSVGRVAAELGAFGDGFSLTRMSWIKPNFLWMMYRSGWATKTDQEVVLAITIKRSGFDAVLAEAVHSVHVPAVYGDHGAWRAALADSDVRLQWDPDHDPYGLKMERRAIQLGVDGAALRRYARNSITHIEDITEFVREQHRHVTANDLSSLVTPREEVYPVSDPEVAARIGVDREWA